MIYRNAKLLGLAKEAPYCFHCRRPNDGTIVAAHANDGMMGKGMRLKAADVPAYLCYSCHHEIDNGSSMSRELCLNIWYRAAVLSMRWALENHPEVFCQRKK